MAKKNLFLVMVSLIVVNVLMCSEGIAAIYKYTDKTGLVYFADDLQSIPLEYRANAKIVSGEIKEEGKGQVAMPQQPISTPMQNNATSVVDAAQKIDANTEKPFSTRLAVSGIVVITAFSLFVLFRIMDADHRRSIAISRVLILWGVAVYLLYAHTGDVISCFASAKNSVTSTQQQAEEKGKKAAKAMQALDALLEKAAASSSAARDN